MKRRIPVKVTRLVLILVNLEVHVLKADMNSLLVEDHNIVKEAMTEILNTTLRTEEVPDTILRREEVLDITRKIQDLEATAGKLLHALRLLMTGFEMMYLQVAGDLTALALQIQNTNLEACLLNTKRTQITPGP